MATRIGKRQQPSSVEDFAHQLSDKMLHCRELNHVWRPYTVQWDAKSKSYHRQMRCTSCRTIRTQLLDSRGHVLSNSYKYPDGYLAKDIKTGGNRDAYRVESVQRFISAHQQEGAA